MNSLYSPQIESDPMFVKFLDANGLKQVGVDFRERCGVYEHPGTGKFPDDKPSRFNGKELMTAYAGFSDGYQGNSEKYAKPFGALNPKTDEPPTSLATSLSAEKSVLKLMKSGELENSIDEESSGDFCEGALRAIRRKLYKQQYWLGRQANTLNE